MPQEILLLGIENPLLDISAEVDKDLLAKYSLKPNDAILAGPEHKPLYNELISKYAVAYIAGGAAQNSLRGAQYILPEGSTAYVGCVGNDSNATLLAEAAKADGLKTLFSLNSNATFLAEAAKADGLKTLYMVSETVPTGLCAVLITDTNRSMVTDLQAANEYSPSHLNQPEIYATVTAAKNYYIGGFFITVSPPSALIIAKHAAQENKSLSLNLSAPFISQFFKEPLAELIGYADILFGNETEAQTFADSNDFGTSDLQEIALRIAALPKVNNKRSRMVVFTHGSEPTIVAFEGKVQTFPVIPITKDQIRDTNGAGDAFVGGTP